MISVTDKAASKIKTALAKRGSGLGIQVGIRTTGCSGLAYVLEYVDDFNLHSMQYYDSNGVRVFIDPKHQPYLQDMVINFVRQGLNEGFEFNNPNERDRCGCGESFRV